MAERVYTRRNFLKKGIQHSKDIALATVAVPATVVLFESCGTDTPKSLETTSTKQPEKDQGPKTFKISELKKNLPSLSVSTPVKLEWDTPQAQQSYLGRGIKPITHTGTTADKAEGINITYQNVVVGTTITRPMNFFLGVEIISNNSKNKPPEFNNFIFISSDDTGNKIIEDSESGSFDLSRVTFRVISVSDTNLSQSHDPESVLNIKGKHILEVTNYEAVSAFSPTPNPLS